MKPELLWYPISYSSLLSSAGRQIGLGWAEGSQKPLFFLDNVVMILVFFSGQARQLVFLSALSWAIMSVIYCNKTIIMC